MLFQAATTRSRTTIIKGLLRRAFNGESQRSLPEMKTMIARRLQNARDLPEGHRHILAAIRAVEKDQHDYRKALMAAGVASADIPAPSRTLTRLSVNERLAGRKVFYESALPDGARPLSVDRIARCREMPAHLNPRPTTFTPQV